MLLDRGVSSSNFLPRDMISFQFEDCAWNHSGRKRLYTFTKHERKEIVGTEGQDHMISTESVEVAVPVEKSAEVSHTEEHRFYSSFVWPAAEVLSSFIVKEKHLFKGAHVLELGAGKALCSLTAKSVGAKSVLATDYHSNKSESIAQLRWGEFDSNNVSLLRNVQNPLNIIIGSDVFYEDHNEDSKAAEVKIDSILSMIILAKTCNPELLFVFSFVNRNFEQYQSLMQLLCNWNFDIVRRIKAEELINNCSSSYRNIEIFVVS
mmetsp:Transcript_15393/g.18669  ORF Transcript_15393/g.18669 Transcript_15393/m.18669 type:complete len:263 (-) Transcript_15393:63-851(-)